MPKVNFEITTQNEKALSNVITKQGRQIDALQRKLDTTGKKGKKTFTSMKVGAKDFALGMIGVNTAAAAVVQTLNLIKQGFQAAQKAQENFYNKNVTLSEARARALWNLPSTFEGGKQGLENLVSKISSSTGTKKENVFEILSAGFSAGGEGATLRSAAEQAARLEKAGVGEGGELVGTGLDLAAVTGQQDAAVNFGFLKQIGSAARLVSLQQQQNLLPALVAGTQQGDTAEQTGELVATITQIIKDTEGRLSATGAIGFTQALADKALIPTIEKVVSRTTGEVKEKVTFDKVEGQTTFERLKNLQDVYAKSNKEQQALIIQQIGGEKKMQAFFKAALSNSELFQKTLTQAQQKITMPGQESAMQIQNFNDMMQTGSDRIVDIGKSLDAAVENLQTSGKNREAIEAKARQATRDYLSSTSSIKANLAVTAESSGFGALAAYQLQEQVGQDPVTSYRKFGQAFAPESDKQTQAYKDWLARMNDLTMEWKKLATDLRQQRSLAEDPNKQEVD